MQNTNSNQAWVDELEKGRMPKAIKRGATIPATVTAVEPGRVLVDINYRSEGEIMGPEIFVEGYREYPKVGETIQVFVINDGAYAGVPRLSIRKTGNLKVWQNLEKAKENGTEVNGVVIEVNTGGCMVALPGNIKGFLPASQLDQTRFAGLHGNRSAGGDNMQEKILEILRPMKGQKIKLGLIEVDAKKQKVLLSEKMLLQSKRSEMAEDVIDGSEIVDAAKLSQQKVILEKFKVGDVVEAQITGFAPFGIFVNSQGLEGLVHISQISWEKVDDVSKLYKIGDKINVKVIAIDPNTARVGFSIKMLDKDPWQSIKEKYKVGDVIKGKVTKVVAYGAFVKIEEGVNGLIHNSEISESSSAKAQDILKDGQDIEAVILHISIPDRQIALSVRNMKKETGNESNSTEEHKKDTKKKRSKKDFDDSEESNEVENVDLESTENSEPKEEVEVTEKKVRKSRKKAEVDNKE